MSNDAKVLFGSPDGAHVVPSNNGYFNVRIGQVGFCTAGQLLQAERLAVQCEVVMARYGVEPERAIAIIGGAR